MSKIKILHSADLHLDSPFEGLPEGKAAIRRGEQRKLLSKLAAVAAEERVDLVLLSGDLLDSANTYFETGEELIRALGSIAAPVFISPGNHDFYGQRSPYARLKLPENVYIFRQNSISAVEVPKLNVRVFGAAFTDSRCQPLLESFCAERRQGITNIMCIHGEVGAALGSPYNPISLEQLSGCGMDYVALGHVHKASGLMRAGETWYSWPGCPEGRGFDETGEKTVNIIELEDGECKLRTRVIASRKYEVMKVDVTGIDPLLAVHTQLPDDTVGDIYRIILTGETEQTPDVNRLDSGLSELFFELQLRDETRLRRSVWDSAGEDSLRGVFLSRLKARHDAAKDEAEKKTIEQAAHWGLAALENREEVVRHGDK